MIRPDPVQIQLGSGTATFFVPREQLINNSDFFATALRLEATKGRTDAVKLPQHNTESFVLWLGWIQWRKIVLETKGEDVEESRELFETLVRAYCLGEKLRDQDFRDVLVDLLAGPYLRSQRNLERHWMPDIPLIDTIYNNTKPRSKLRDWLCRLTLDDPECTSRLTEKDNLNYLLDIARHAVAASQPNVKQENPGCALHCHDPGENNCYRRKYQQINPDAANRSQPTEHSRTLESHPNQ